MERMTIGASVPISRRLAEGRKGGFLRPTCLTTRKGQIQSLVEAAQDLGASTTKTLVRVLIPMSVPGISTGITMVFVPAVSTFVISRLLGGGSILLIGDLIEMQFLGNSYNLNVGSAMSLVLMIIVLLCMSFTSSFDEDEMEGVS